MSRKKPGKRPAFASKNVVKDSHSRDEAEKVARAVAVAPPFPLRAENISGAGVRQAQLQKTDYSVPAAHQLARLREAHRQHQVRSAVNPVVGSWQVDSRSDYAPAGYSQSSKRMADEFDADE